MSLNLLAALGALLPPWPLFTAFVAASFVLAITPGPGVFYIVTRSITQGRKAGLASVMGVALGNFGNAAGAALGLAALFTVSTLAFTVVKYAGAGYLIYMGVRTLRQPRAAVQAGGPLPPVRLSRLFRDGFVVALLNPKTALFFAAFLPQFMHAHAPVVAQCLLLGGIFVAIAAVTDSLYALLAALAAPMVARGSGLKTFGRWASGGAFIGLGLLTALSSHNQPAK